MSLRLQLFFDVEQSTIPHAVLLTQALDDVKTSRLHPPAKFLSDRLVGYHGNDPIKLLKQLLFTNHKAFADVVAKTKSMVDHRVNKTDYQW